MTIGFDGAQVAQWNAAVARDVGKLESGRDSRFAQHRAQPLRCCAGRGSEIGRRFRFGFQADFLWFLRRNPRAGSNFGGKVVAGVAAVNRRGTVQPRITAA